MSNSSIQTSVDSQEDAVPATSTNNRVRWFTVAAAAGGLGLVAYAYVAARWGSLDTAGTLVLVFGLLLIGYAALAVVGVRARVIAPFVAAALLLPWLCGGAAAIAVRDRVGSAIEDFSNDLSGGTDESLEELPLEEPSAEPSEPDAGGDAVPPVYTEDQIVGFLALTEGGLKVDGTTYGEWTYTDATGDKCGVSQIFTNAGAVQTYAQVQDNVAMSAEGNVGVEVQSPEEDTCMTLLGVALGDFETLMSTDDD